MDLERLKLKKKYDENILCVLLVFVFSFILIPVNSFAAESLSYSGRLVKADGSPVTGPVKLKVELSYTNDPTTILCSQNLTGVSLSNGVFHLKLDLVCPSTTLSEVLTSVPATFAAALRVTDTTDANVSNHKTYAFQEIHSMPFANIAETAKQLVQMGATSGKVLAWDGTKWAPATASAGSVTNVTVTAPLAVANGSSTPALSIVQANTGTDGYLSATDWNTFNNKIGVTAGGTATQFYRGDNTWQTLNTDAVPDAGMTNLYFTNARALGVPLGASLDVALLGPITSADTVLTAFGRTQNQINLINTNSSGYVTKMGTSTMVAAGTIDAQLGFVLVGAPGSLNDATPRGYVNDQDALKVSKAGDTMSGVLTLDSDLKIKSGTTTNYVTIKGHATSDNYNLFLPQTDGNAGEVLQTDGVGNLIWINPNTLAAGTGTVNSSSITDDSIVNADINSAAAIDQSKIAGLVTALAGKQTTALTNGKMLVGNVGNLAAPVTMSGDATLSDLGALTLVNSGVAANTYKSVSVDVKGRVTGGTNPTTLAGFGITDTLVTGVTATAPITITGTTAPLIAMPAATNAVDGYLTAADRTAFNAKQDAITASSTLNSREIRFNELTGNGAEYVALKAPDALAANTTYILPLADGSTGQVLTTNAAGVLSWTTVATTGTTLAGDVGGTISANSIGTGKVTSSHLLDGTIVNADINAAAAIDYSKLSVPALAVPLTALNATGTKDATKYLKGDNTWSVLQTDVQALLLSSYTIGTNAVVATGDSIVSAFGKLQKQITDLTTRAVGGDLSGNLPNPTIAKIQGSPVSITTPAIKQVLKYNGTTWVNAQVAAGDLSATGTVDATTYLAGDNSWKNFNSGVIAAPITGVNTTGITKATSALVGTDSLLTSFNKLLFTQGDYVSKTANQTINGTLAINSLTGFITVPTPLVANDAASKGYVDSYGQWLEGTGGNINDIYFSTGKVGIGTTGPTESLQVNGNVRIGVVTPAGTVDSPGYGAKLFLSGGPAQNGRDSDNSDVIWLSRYNIAADSSEVHLSIGDNNSALDAFSIGYTNGSWFPFFKVQGNGNVGIGTTAPAEKLEIAGRAYANSYELNASSGFSGGTRTGIAAPAAVTLGLYSNGNERMRIDGTGNVGVGSTNPTERLDVTGNGKFSGSVTAASFSGNGSGLTNISSTSHNHLLDYGPGYSGGLVPFSSANTGVNAFQDYTGTALGIGSNFWAGVTAQNSNSGAQFALNWNAETGSTSAFNVRVKDDNQATWGTWRSVAFADTTVAKAGSTMTGTLNLPANGLNVGSGQLIATGGNIGIGTANPTEKLSLYGNLDLRSSTTMMGSGAVGGIRMYNQQSTNSADYLNIGWIGENIWGLQSADEVTYKNLVLNPYGGNVGIGTIAPSTKLHISDPTTNVVARIESVAASTSAQLNINSAVAGYPHILFTQGGTGRFEMGQVASNGNFYFNNNTQAGEASAAMVISKTGNVGIGTTAPSYLLDVNGTTRSNSIIGGQFNGSGNLHIDAWTTGATRAVYLNWSAGTGGAVVGNGASGYGPIAASAFNINSDRNLKTNIEPIDGALAIIDQLNGVKFDWISPKESSNRQVGVIAQDVQKVLPELVSINKENKRLTVNYSGLVAPLIEAVKELYHKWLDDHARIDRLEVDNAKKNREIASLKAGQEEHSKKLQQDINELRSVVCAMNPATKVCLSSKRTQK